MSSPWTLDLLPIPIDLETKRVLKSLPAAHAALAELKVLATSIPNQNILINTFALQEAKDSSAIENIITTHDELFKSGLKFDSFTSAGAKEVQNYIEALKVGFDLIQKTGLLTNKTILQVQEVLEKNNAGFRKLPGTALKNAITGETIYTPPQDPEEIIRLMTNLENYINDTTLDPFDPLVKMALIHFQFESIHPFYDGNGRTGRIINILYLILQDLQSLPVLYLSSYIIQHKSRYYHLLQNIRQESLWEEWILFMVNGITETALETIELIKDIKALMQETEGKLKNQYKFYSPELVHNLFKHPYTKIEFLVQDLSVSRITAANYLNQLTEDGILRKEKLGTGNYYINEPLFTLITHRHLP